MEESRHFPWPRLPIAATSWRGGGADADSAFGYLVKTSASGNEIWRSRLYVTGSAPSSVTSVVTLGDTSYAAIVKDAGDSAVIFWRIDSGGRFRTSRKYDIGYSLEWTDEDLSMRRTSDGGYIIGTRTLLKVGSQGENPQLKTFGSVVSANSVIQTSDGGYAATGAKPGAGIYLLKTNTNRDSLWMNAYAQSEFSRGHWIEQTTPDGGYIIAGTTRPGNHQGDKVTLVRTSSNGTLQWTDTLFSGYGNCIRQTADGGFIVCGMRYNSLFVTKLAPDRTR